MNARRMVSRASLVRTPGLDRHGLNHFVQRGILSEVDPQFLSPDESLHSVPSVTVGDFWRWAYSGVLSNRNRSILAEFIVGSALGVVRSPRVERAAVDLRYNGYYSI